MALASPHPFLPDCGFPCLLACMWPPSPRGSGVTLPPLPADRLQGAGPRGTEGSPPCSPTTQPEPAGATVGHACRPLQSSAHVSPCLTEPPRPSPNCPPRTRPRPGLLPLWPHRQGWSALAAQASPGRLSATTCTRRPAGLGLPQENRPILQMRKLRPRQVRACLGSLGVAAQWGEENSSLHQPHQVVSRACQVLQRLWGGYHPHSHHGCTEVPSACMAPTAGQ